MFEGDQRRRWQGTDRDVYQDWLDFAAGKKEPRTELGEKKLSCKKGQLWQNLGRNPSSFRMMRAMMIEREDTVAGEPDRIPFWCMSGTFGAKLVNSEIEEYASNAELLAKAQMTLVDKYGVDAVVPFSDMGCVAEAWGTKTRFDAVPYTSEYIITGAKDWENLDFIQDTKWPESGRISQVFQACMKIWDKYGFSIPFYGVIPSPLTLACWLGGIDRVKIDMKEAPESFHLGMVELADSVIALVKAYFDSAVIVSVMDFQHACADAFTLEEYLEFGVRYDLKVFERCKNFMPFIGHFAGKEPYLDIATSLYPLILLNWDSAGSNCSLSEAKKAYKRKVAIASGVNNETLLKGSTADVETEAKNAIELGKQDRSGFILAPGRELSYETPEENIAAMVEAAKKYGSYPPPKWKTDKWDIKWERNKRSYS